MDWYFLATLFVLGTAIGSFLNVVILRFDPDRKLFQGIGGRSECMSCKKILRWYELMPLLSYLIQFGRCRSCKVPLTFQYPAVEFLTGLFFMAIPYLLVPTGPDPAIPYIQIGIWLTLFICLILISVVDLRLYIIPNGLNLTIGVLALINLLDLHFGGGFGTAKDEIYRSLFGTHSVIAGSFLGTQAAFLWISDNLWLNFIYGGLFGGAFFGLIYFLSGGRAMGFGDVKMALAAGFLLGFPDMILATMLAFISGAIAGLMLMTFGKKGIKDYLPFGPFIALGITLVFFFGYDIVNGYFQFFSFLE